MKEAVCIFCMTGAACTMKDIPDIPVDTKKQKKNPCVTRLMEIKLLTFRQ